MSPLAMRVATNPLEAACAALLEHGLDGAGEMLGTCLQQAGGCARPMAWNASIGSSNAAPGWRASSRIPIPACAWSCALLAELDDEWLSGKV